MKKTTEETTKKAVRETVLIDRITRLLDGLTPQTKMRVLDYVRGGVIEELDVFYRAESAKMNVGPANGIFAKHPVHS